MIPNWVNPNPKEVVWLDIESEQPVHVDGTISLEARITGLKFITSSPAFKLIGARIPSAFVVLPDVKKGWEHSPGGYGGGKAEVVEEFLAAYNFRSKSLLNRTDNDWLEIRTQSDQYCRKMGLFPPLSKRKTEL